MIIQEALSFDDVLLVPRFSSIESRKEVSIGNNFSTHENFRIPIISSPMDTVTSSEMAIAMSKMGGLGILHRYNSIEEQALLCKEVFTSEGLCAAAIGVKDDYLERARRLYSSGCTIFCIDIAHGHHISMARALEKLKNEFDDRVHLMAGNIATAKGFIDLSKWGADSVRVGIGGGSICETRIKTGHGIPTLQSVFDCAHAKEEGDLITTIIADGGIKNSGDIVKALAAGADFVMLGSLLAGTTEAPGEIIDYHGQKYKNYRGMASKEAQMSWTGIVNSEEGVSAKVQWKGTVSDVVSSLEKGIRSGFSYSGATNILQFQMVSQFIKQSSAGQLESSTHILDRAAK